MNVIFLDIDGVMASRKYTNEHMNMCIEDVCDAGLEPEKIELLFEICKLYNAKVVISSSWKLGIEDDYIPLSVIGMLTDLEDNSIEVIGFTPNIPNESRCYGHDMWKDYDIACYLYEHPEVESFCIIDDNAENDINNLKDYLVKTSYSIDEEGHGGLLPEHVNEVGLVLQKSKNYKR